jgi:hypothetical protein
VGGLCQVSTGVGHVTSKPPSFTSFNHFDLTINDPATADHVGYAGIAPVPCCIPPSKPALGPLHAASLSYLGN